MAFIAMIFASIFLIVVALGIGSLFIGIILDIIWHSKKRKQKPVSKVLKVFAIIFTVLGILQGICPIAVVGIGAAARQVERHSRISDIPKEAIVKIDCNSVSRFDSFDFKGKHYILAWELSDPNYSVDYDNNSIGAIVYTDGYNCRIAKLDNEPNKDILLLEDYLNPFVVESDMDEIKDYYLHRATINCEVNIDSIDYCKSTSDVDMEHIYAIKEYIDSKGGSTEGEQPENDSDGYLSFTSTDGVFNVSMNYKETDQGLALCNNENRYVLVSDEDAEYIRSLIK